MGTFDGNGKTIKNLTLDTESDFTALFGYSGGTLKDFTVEGNVTVTGSHHYISGVCGFNAGTIQRVVNKVNITASESFDVGGIAGVNASAKWDEKLNGYTLTRRELAGAVGSITECGNEGDLVLYRVSGGVVGGNYGTISRCYNKGSMDLKDSNRGRTSDLGGIAGTCGSNTEHGVGHIVSCYNTGDFKTAATNGYGGITGRKSTNSSVTNCYSSGSMGNSGQEHAPIVPVYNNGKMISNNYSLEGSSTSKTGDAYANGTQKTAEEMKADSFITELGGSYVKNDGSMPVLKWEKGTSLKATSVIIDMTDFRTEYIESESIDVSGIRAYIAYDDGSREQLSAASITLDKSGALALSDDNSEINVTAAWNGLTETKKATIKVEGKKLDSIVLAGLPNKYVYESGQSFDPTGMKITAKYSNYSKEDRITDVTKLTCTTNGALTPDNNKVVVKYTLNGVTREDSFDVKVIELSGAPAKDADGTYEMKTADDIVWLSNKVYLGDAVNAKLMKDIDISGREDFNPIGISESVKVTSANGGGPFNKSCGSVFTGMLDGNGKTIKIALDRPDSGSTALISRAKDLEVKDLTVDGSVKGLTNTAGIVAYASGTLKITNCNNKADITGLGSNAGGILGNAARIDAEITNCTNSGKVETPNSSVAGGIMGYGEKSIITSCTNRGEISVSPSGNNAGGIAGSGSIAVKCVNEGSVTGGSYAGGIFGNAENSRGNITESANTGSVKGTKTVGGIVGGGFLPTIDKTYNKGSVEATEASAKDGVGGLYGTKKNGLLLSITDSYNAGDVTASGTSVTGVCGQFVGIADARANFGTTISNSYYLQDKNAAVGSVGTAPEGTLNDASAPKTLEELSELAPTLGAVYQNSCGGAVFTWQSAADHDMSEWSEDTATFTEDGEQTRACSVCGKTESRVTNATGVGTTIQSIDDIGEVTLESAALIKAARDNYDRLLETQKEQVTNYSKLTDAEKMYAELRAAADKEEADKAAAAGVSDLINKINDPVTSKDKDAIEAANAAYDALTDDQKAMLSETDKSKLEAANPQLAKLIEQEKKDNSSKNTGKDSSGAAGTGDTTALMPVLVLMLIAAAVACTVVLKRKKSC